MLVTSQLCEVINSDGSELDNRLLDPCFFSAKEYQQLFSDGTDERVLSHLAHRIQRAPADLIAHIQRLEIYHQKNNRDGLYGALLDLFIALGDKGEPLRLRMLRGIRGRLTAQQRALFEAKMECGITSTSLAPLTCYSRLSAAVNGSLQIAERSAISDSSQNITLLDDVRDLLNSGQVEQAQGLLENALQKQPELEDISLELLMIYRHSKNIEAFQKTYRAMEGRFLAAQEAWDQQAEDFGI